ncbi:IPT/TIG domain-containing protein, partial [Candidatus Saccharibacteria bacterium]|nr:IPT/TIG domain-containing protein [Candidatus Saccharibacteria bacterium]
NNTWGYDVGAASVVLEDFKAIPLPDGPPDTINSSSTPIEDDETIVTFGAKADMTQKVGVYSQIITFTAVTNPVPPPTVVSVDPDPTSPGETVTITGTNFYAGGASSGVLSVLIGPSSVGGGSSAAMRCTDRVVISNTELTCTVPELEPGIYPVIVKTFGGASNDDVEIEIVILPTMQEFTTAMCEAMPIHYNATDPYPTNPTNPPAGSEIDLVDARDGKVYKIRKLAKIPSPVNQATDGWCWMVDNLALDLRLPGNVLVILDDTTSDITSGTYVVPDPMNPGVDSSINAAAPCLTLDISLYPHKCGFGYRYNTATVGSATALTSGPAPDSVCPKNWRLPTGEPTTGDFTLLATALGWGGYNVNRVNDINGWRGVFTANVSNWPLGLYWSSTASGATTNAYVLNYGLLNGGVTYVSPANSQNRNAAATSVRCLAR